MHREIEAMKEAVAGDREVAPELEEHPGIRLEKSSDRLSMFFFPSQITIGALGLKQIIGVDEQHLMPPLLCVPMSSTASNTFPVQVPSISPLMRFANLSLRSPAINFLVSNSSAIQQVPRDISSPMPERVKAPAQTNDEPSSASPSALWAVRMSRVR